MLCLAFLNQLQILQAWVVMQYCMLVAKESMFLCFLLSLGKVVIELEIEQTGRVNTEERRPAW